MTARIYALCNQKGGVGKSTTAFHLARAAVLRGRRVLLVDADPQGNLTSVVAADQVAADQVGLADVLSARAEEKLRDVVVPGIWPGLDLVPTTGIELGWVRDELVATSVGREARLREALAELREDYDLVLIDCAPSLDQLTINGMTAADAVLIVTQSKLWSANGLAQLLDTIGSVRQHYNHGLHVAGVIVNQHEDRTRAGRHWLEVLTEATTVRGLRILQPPVPKRVVVSDATEVAQGLDEVGGAESAALAAIYADYLTDLEGEPA